MEQVESEEGLERFSFSGKGGEYFRIWIVNLLLSIVTLGIYSAWAKVRREQYFHRNTLLAGSSFEYHAQPMSILKGRLLVIGVMIAYNLLGAFSPIFAILFGLLFVVAAPWITRQALRFRTWNTSWRGVRMGFAGTTGGIAKVLYLYGLAVPFSLGLAMPWWLNRYHSYIVSQLRFGDQEFEAKPPVWDYYKPHLVLAGLSILLIVAFVAIIGVVVAVGTSGGAESIDKERIGFLGGVVAVLFYGLLFFAGSTYVRVRLGNALWNNTRVGEHQFVSSLQARKLFWLVLSNTLGIVLTLGFFMPFAKVRMARYRAACMAIQVEGSLDDFMARQDERIRATGDEAADLLDIDLGF